MTPDWHFEVVSAVQRFICETTDAPSSQVIACGGALVTAIPRPASPGDRPILRSILFELAIEWDFGGICVFDRDVAIRRACR